MKLTVQSESGSGFLRNWDKIHKTSYGKFVRF